MRSGLTKALGLVVTSAVVVTFSETFYWYSGGTGFAPRVVVYLIPTTILLWAMADATRISMPTTLLLGAVYGFVTEGVLTPVMYGGFPLDPFALSYTALAWHAPISVWFGLVVLHRLLSDGPTTMIVAASAGFGAFWGFWAMTLRLPPDADTEPAALSALVGDVDPATFAGFTLAATAMVAIGHVVLGRLRPEHLVTGIWWRRIILVLGLLWFATLVAPSVLWAVPELMLMLWLTRRALRRLTGNDDLLRLPGRRPSPPAAPSGYLVHLTCPVDLGRVALLAVVPVMATACYAALVAAGPSDEVIHDVILVPMVTAQTLAGLALFAWALLAAARAGRVTRVG